MLTTLGWIGEAPSTEPRSSRSAAGEPGPIAGPAMSSAVTTWALVLTGGALLVGGVGTENMPALWIAMAAGAASLVLAWWLTRRRRSERREVSVKKSRFSGATQPTRRELIEAQVAIFENQDREEAAGVHEETSE